MMKTINYRDEKPEFLKDLTSDGIMNYFEDERATEEDINWFKEILNSTDYQMKQNPVSHWNWGKIKTAFAMKYFPEIAPAGTVIKKISMQDRVLAFLNT